MNFHSYFNYFQTAIHKLTRFGKSERISRLRRAKLKSDYGSRREESEGKPSTVTHLDDKGRITVCVNRRRRLTLRALGRHPRRRAGIAPNTTAGAALLQIPRTPLLPYLETLHREKILLDNASTSAKCFANHLPLLAGSDLTEKMPFFKDFSVRLFLLAGGSSLLAFNTNPPRLSSTRRSLLSVGSGVGATSGPPSALLNDVKDALTCFGGL